MNIEQGHMLDTLHRLYRRQVARLFPPAVRLQKRPLAADYAGPIFIWDVDRTYVDSKVDGIGDVIRIAREKARDKVNVPGSAALLRGLRRGPGAGDARCPVYFLTAGPPQVGPVFEEKLRMDGVQCDGLIFKSFTYYLLSLQAPRLREHVGYKLAALLQNRLEFPEQAHEILFGDNSDQDPDIYALYARMVRREVSPGEVERRIGELRVLPEERDEIMYLWEQVPEGDPVRGIYIHLARPEEPARLERLDKRLLAGRNMFQAACHLAARGYLSAEGLLAVAENMRGRYHFTRRALTGALLDLRNRGFVENDFVEWVIELLRREDHLPAGLRPEDRQTVAPGAE
jgi:hypothetical protein